MRSGRHQTILKMRCNYAHFTKHPMSLSARQKVVDFGVGCGLRIANNRHTRYALIRARQPFPNHLLWDVILDPHDVCIHASIYVTFLWSRQIRAARPNPRTAVSSI